MKTDVQLCLKISAVLLAIAPARGSIARPSDHGDHNGGRVVGGSTALSGEFPFVVQLWLSGNYYCGGSILSEKVILTAAHCLKNPRNLQVVAGVRCFNDSGPHVQRVGISEAFQHPKYPRISPHDIGLIVLKEALTYNEFVQPVALPDEDDYQPAGDSTLVGFGNISNSTIFRLPECLQKATVPILTDEECQSSYPGLYKNSTNICTGPLGGNLSSCSGDSGTGLTQMVNNVRTVVGVVSWGTVPCGRGHPSVYAKVSAFLDFIKQHLVPS